MLDQFKNSKEAHPISILLSTSSALVLALTAMSPAMSQSLPQKACRWHPGHYLSMTGENRSTADMEKVLNKNTPFKGVQKLYSWAALEPSPGHYDFSLIKSDLESLRRRNKRLIVQISAKTPHSGLRANHPSFLKGSPRPEGGNFAAVFVNRRGGYNLAFWDPAVARKCGNLYAALGRCLSSDANVSALEVVNLEDTSWGNQKDDAQALTKAGTMPYNREKYGQHLMLMYKALNDSLSNTVAIQYVNNPADLVPYFVDQLFNLGGGIGGPALRTDTNLPLYSHLPNLAGILPIGFATDADTTTSASSQTISRSDVVRVLKFAQHMKLNYLMWVERSGDSRIVEEVLKDPAVVNQKDPSGGLVSTYPLTVAPFRTTSTGGGVAALP